MRLIASVLALLLLAACQPAPEAGCARACRALGSIALQDSPKPHFETLQESVLSAGGQRHILLTRLGNDETGLRFVALSPLARRCSPFHGKMAPCTRRCPRPWPVGSIRPCSRR